MASLDFAKYLFAILLAIAATGPIWSGLVDARVPSPYLDEVFHVRQAQVYCSGDFQTWDPKITTPPGLYLVSYVVFLLFGKCDISTLRAVNLQCLTLVALEVFYILKLLWRLYYERWDSKSLTKNAKSEQAILWYLAHTAINVVLFPPFFFFSSLYYTDVASVLFVLVSLHISLLQLEIQRFNLILLISQIAFGVAALFFRQTNIFWVAVFPLGLTVVENCLSAVKGWKSLDKTKDSIEEYIYLVIEMIPTLFLQVLPIILASIQYVILLGGFALFVFWNGGVVLGDKSNHVATLHLPQMLYIWPYILFFTWPLALKAIYPKLVYLSKSSQAVFADIPRIWILVLFTTLALAVVHYNTIIHPFTLADNRHYVFYVFRLLRRHWLIKYLAAPIYVITGWLVILTTKESWMQSDLQSKQATTAQARAYRNGFFLVWLASSALSLITAPLVEPRYFILPWLIWRLQAAIPQRSVEGRQGKSKDKVLAPPAAPSRLDHWWLALETGWYIVINLATGYIFLNWTFEWPQEPGMKQRFMW